jgi:hypothetical protein
MPQATKEWMAKNIPWQKFTNGSRDTHQENKTRESKVERKIIEDEEGGKKKEKKKRDMIKTRVTRCWN